MTNEQIAEIEARANAAVPGPWVSRKHGPTDWYFVRQLQWTPCEDPFDDDCAVGEAVFASGAHSGPRDERNITFIAHARADIPALIAALRAERARVAELEKEHTRLRVAIGSVAEDAILCEAGYSSPTFDALVHKIKRRVDSAIDDAGRRIANSDKGDPTMRALGIVEQVTP